MANGNQIKKDLSDWSTGDLRSELEAMSEPQASYEWEAETELSA